MVEQPRIGAGSARRHLRDEDVRLLQRMSGNRRRVSFAVCAHCGRPTEQQNRHRRQATRRTCGWRLTCCSADQLRRPSLPGERPKAPVILERAYGLGRSNRNVSSGNPTAMRQPSAPR